MYYLQAMEFKLTSGAPSKQSALYLLMLDLVQYAAHHSITQSVQNKEQHLDFIKDPYVLAVLDVPEDLKGQESLLESNIIEHLQKFLYLSKDVPLWFLKFKVQGQIL